MKKILYIGDNHLLQYFSSMNIAEVEAFDPSITEFPKVQGNFDGILIQTELLDNEMLFHHVEVTLPYLLMYDFKVRPIILTGFLPRNYFQDRFRLPFSGHNGTERGLGIEFLRLPLHENSLDEILTKYADHDSLDLVHTGKAWKQFFKMVNFGSKIDHIMNKIVSGEDYDMLLFNNYRNKYYWI
ncbi:MAG: hypothetical protein AAFZ15_32135 [Bacteroidota bacterium]